MSNSNIDAKLTQNLDQLSAGSQLAIVLCANAFRFGGNWGFIRSGKDNFRGMLETLKEERPHIKTIPVANGALILSNENFLAHNVNVAVPNAINGSFVEMAKKRKSEERAKFSKFIDNVIAGKNSHVKKKNGYYELVLGIYCVNDTNYIRLNGIEYPAYKLTLMEVLDYARCIIKTGRKIYARAVNEEGKEVFSMVENLANSPKGRVALYKGLEISETDTGLFLTLRIV